MDVLFTTPALVIVTGAGKGFGKALSLVHAQHLAAGSCILLLGRNRDDLTLTKEDILKLNSLVSVLIYSDYDCSNLDTDSLSAFLGNCKETALNSLETLILIHNAGTVGNPSQNLLSVDPSQVRSHMEINFVAKLATNNLVLQILSGIKRKIVVHVSSLCAVAPIKSLSLYCMGKAAGDMLFKVLAVERPDIRVLNYAPGPLATAMHDLVKNTSVDPDTKKTFEECQPLDPMDSANKLIRILKEDKYESGQHVDYFDVNN